MIYFDNAATTRMADEVIDEMNRSFLEDYANPSSLHSLGFGVEKKIKEARKKIAGRLGVADKDLFFAPSATLANNFVLNSFLQDGKNIIISEGEHSSIRNFARNREGYDIRFARLDKEGFVDKDHLLSLVDDNTVLVSIIHVQNELGSINDIGDLARAVKERNEGIFFHSDGVQAFNKIDIDLANVDAYTISAHKINGPKGLAALYMKEARRAKALYFGGGQEADIFPGTENTYSIRGLSKAIDLDNNYSDIYDLNKYIRDQVSKIRGVKIVSPEKSYSPYILNISIEGIGAEILLHYLEMDQVYISTGSACSKGAESQVLKAIGLSEEEIKGCIRISFDRSSNMEEARRFVELLKGKVEIIRNIIGR